VVSMHPARVFRRVARRRFIAYCQNLIRGQIVVKDRHASRLRDAHVLPLQSSFLSSKYVHGNRCQAVRQLFSFQSVSLFPFGRSV
jgi:hypothetical protein